MRERRGNQTIVTAILAAALGLWSVGCAIEGTHDPSSLETFNTQAAEHCVQTGGLWDNVDGEDVCVCFYPKAALDDACVPEAEAAAACTGSGGSWEDDGTGVSRCTCPAGSADPRTGACAP